MSESSVEKILEADSQTPVLARDNISSFSLTIQDELTSIRGGPILQSGFGDLLQRTRRANEFLLVLLLLFTFFFFAPVSPEVDEGISDDGSKITFTRPHVVWLCATDVLLIAICIMMLHIMNRQIFLRCARTFEFYMIGLSTASARLAWLYNWIYVFSPGGACYLYIVLDCGAWLLSSVVIAGVDSLQMGLKPNPNRWWRVIVCLIMVHGFFLHYVLIQLEWKYADFFQSPPEFGWWMMKTDAKTFHMACILQVVLFINRALFMYVMGYPFASVVPHYSIKDMVTLDKQAKEIASDVTDAVAQEFQEMARRMRSSDELSGTTNPPGESQTLRLPGTTSPLGEPQTLRFSGTTSPLGEPQALPLSGTTSSLGEAQTLRDTAISLPPANTSQA